MRFNAPKHTYTAGESAAKYEPRRLSSVDNIVDFMMAGNATLTLKSVRTGTRFTFRVKAAPDLEEGNPGPVSHFVALMNGPDNEKDFNYLGHIYRDNHNYSHGRKSKIGVDAPSAKAFQWFHDTVVLGHTLHDHLEVWHEGRCGRCNRKLTVPESIASGFGPECIKMMSRLQRVGAQAKMTL